MVPLRNQEEGVLIVIPAKAGIQKNQVSIWIPAFAGMTGNSLANLVSSIT